MNSHVLRTRALVSVVIPSFNRRDQLRRAIQCVLLNDLKEIEVIVVDDASTDGTGEMIRAEFPQVKYARHARRTLTSEALNDGFRFAQADIIVIVSDDTYTRPDSLSLFLQTFQTDPRIGFVGSVSYYADAPDQIQFAGSSIRRFTRDFRPVARFGKNIIIPDGIRDVDIVDNCIALRKSVLQRVGLIDSERIPFYHECTSLQLRAKRLGYRIVRNSKIRVLHDIPREAGLSRVMSSDLKAYYSMRSKIAVEKYNDNPLGVATFALSIPWYLAVYVTLGLIGSSSKKSRVRRVLVILRGLKDGLFSDWSLHYLR